MRFVRQYFGQLASYSFVTAPDGTRLFYAGLPRARPYIVPDAETEQRLFKKQQWVMAITMCSVLLVTPFLGRTPSALALIGAIVGAPVVCLVAQYFLIRTEIRRLTPAAKPPTRKELRAIAVARHSTTRLVVYLVMTLPLLAIPLFLMPPGMDPVVKWLLAGIMGLIVVGLGYQIVLKLSRKVEAERQPAPDGQ
jgi:purine-cytosine permease-like protein